MKRIVALLLALSMIIAVSFALSSCELISGTTPDNKEDVITVEDGYLVVNGVKTEYKVLVEDEAPDNTEDEGNTENGDNNENGDNTKVRTTITAEEWTANMGQTNFTVTLEQVEGTETTKGIASITETNKSVEVLEPVEQMAYFAIQDGKSYYVTKAEESWYGSYESYPFDTVYAIVAQGNTFEYDDFVYNAEIKAYVYSFEEEDGDDWTYKCYFEDGKIVKAEINANITNYDGTKTSTFAVESFSDFGTTVVEVPEFSIVDNGSGNAPNEGAENGTSGIGDSQEN